MNGWETVITVIVVMVVASGLGLLYSWLLHRALNNPKALPRNPKEVIRRMSRVCDERNMVEQVYPKVAARAGEEFAPQGIVLLLTLATYDFSQQYPPPSGAIVQRFVPLWIDALIDDKKTAEDAKQWLKQIEDDAEAERKAKTPPRVEPEGSIEDDNLYAAMRKIADIFFEEVKKADKEGKIRAEFGDDGVNPFYNQTGSGLFLEYYYGQPDKVWTPWGYWRFLWNVSYSGDAPWEEILSNVLQRLGATEYMPERNLSYGTVGPVYAIHRVDDIELPEPKEREQQNYLERGVAKKAWEAMTQRYHAAAVTQ